MVIQYPHIIIIRSAVEPIKDEHGDYAISEPIEIFKGFCRAEPNGKGSILKGEDGNEINFSFTVFMPNTLTDIPFNSEVEITINNKLVSGRVKRYHPGQLNARIWV